MRKAPCASVVVPRLVPRTTTLTPGMGLPSSAAVTLPVTVRSCATTPSAVKPLRMTARSHFCRTFVINQESWRNEKEVNTLPKVWLLRA